MSQLERQQSILRLLGERPSVTVREIAEALFFSESSVRRDVRELEARGLVTHLWGGVMLTSQFGDILPVSVRESNQGSNKDLIARQAASLVRDGDTLLLDASSTVRRMIGYLGERRNLCIITNNQRIFDETLPKSFRLLCTGGNFSPENRDFYGPVAERMLSCVRADLLFFSAQGLSESGEINDASEEETALRRVMLSRAGKRIFLCDSSKIGIAKPFVLCSLDDVDEVISDAPERIRALRAPGNRI